MAKSKVTSASRLKINWIRVAGICFAFGLFLFVASLFSWAAEYQQRPYTIRLDGGGSVDEYFEKYQNLHDSNRLVKIDGPCLSACTLALGLIEPENLCYTQHALLGFHSAIEVSFNKEGEVESQEYSLDGTMLLWHTYPQQTRRWLTRTYGWSGQEHPNIIWVEANEIPMLGVKACR